MEKNPDPVIEDEGNSSDVQIIEHNVSLIEILSSDKENDSVNLRESEEYTEFEHSPSMPNCSYGKDNECDVSSGSRRSNFSSLTNITDYHSSDYDEVFRQHNEDSGDQTSDEREPQRDLPESHGKKRRHSSRSTSRRGEREEPENSSTPNSDQPQSDLPESHGKKRRHSSRSTSRRGEREEPENSSTPNSDQPQRDLPEAHGNKRRHSSRSTSRRGEREEPENSSTPNSDQSQSDLPESHRKKSRQPSCSTSRRRERKERENNSAPQLLFPVREHGDANDGECDHDFKGYEGDSEDSIN